jgi:hypothetical protein
MSRISERREDGHAGKPATRWSPKRAANGGISAKGTLAVLRHADPRTTGEGARSCGSLSSISFLLAMVCACVCRRHRA